MRILVVDRDDLARQLMKAKMTPLGLDVSEENAKNNALERVGKEDFDAIFIDPAPLTHARPVVLGIRRAMRHYPYIVLMSENASLQEALAAGANDFLAKPVDSSLLEEKAANAKRLVNLTMRIGDESEDFPSAGGVIAKSAFNQLFLSALERSDRYAERSYILFFTLENYMQIRDMDGPYAADYAVARLSQALVRLRRQSDIIAQTGKNEFALLLQRPQYETEPKEAAQRFSESLSNSAEINGEGLSAPQVRVWLTDLPVGNLLFEYLIQPEHTEALQSGD